MKLWKSLLASVLAILLMMSLSVSAFAAYTDVPDGNGYLEYIELVDALGLISANTMGDFNPVNYYTRGEALVTAYRMLNPSDSGLEEYQSGAQLFDDVDSNNPYFPYINWAYDNSLITNEMEEPVFSPADPISGAEFLTLFVKVGGIDVEAALGSSSGGEDDFGGSNAGGSVEITYPDSYIDAAFDFAGDVMGDEDAITREMAAMTIAQLLWYQDSDTLIDLSVITDDAGNYLDCFATKVYGVNKVDLNIRGTKDRKMGFDFDGDVLLSNGYVMSTEEDLSRYIGHPITVTFRDTDRSGTLTSDENVIYYTVNSSMMLQPTIAEIALSNYTTFTVSNVGLKFNITNATKFYYNDEPWPEDALMNLVSIAGGVGDASYITGRPNMVFTVVASDILDVSTNNALISQVFVEEHHPAKIVDISNGAYTLYDYYNIGNEKEYQQFDANNIVFRTSSASVGDYVNFYESNGTCYILEGSALRTKITSVGSGNTLTLEDGTVVTPHQRFHRANTLPKTDKEVVVITEDVTGKTYLGWEYPTAQEKLPAMVLSYSEKGNYVEYTVYDCATDAESKLQVNIDDLDVSSAIEEGEFIYYSISGEGNVIVERANISDKVHLGVETDSYFVESTTGRIYNKSQYYYGNLYTDTFKADYYKMILDVAGNVLALE